MGKILIDWLILLVVSARGDGFAVVAVSPTAGGVTHGFLLLNSADGGILDSHLDSRFRGNDGGITGMTIKAGRSACEQALAPVATTPVRC